jgi:hypothetical protein
MLYLEEKFWFRIFKYIFCAIYILLMIIANLIGFGMGHNDLYGILLKIWNETNLIYLTKVISFLIPSVIVMFYVREKERENNKNINF